MQITLINFKFFSFFCKSGITRHKIMLKPEEFEKVESHLYKKKGRKHSVRLQVNRNKSIKENKKRLTSSLLDFY